MLGNLTALFGRDAYNTYGHHVNSMPLILSKPGLRKRTPPPGHQSTGTRAPDAGSEDCLRVMHLHPMMTEDRRFVWF